jgi:hypothetical protein
MHGPEGGGAQQCAPPTRQIRLVSYYPELAASVPVREISRVAAGAGGAILAASANRGPAREEAFAELAQRWRRIPPQVVPPPIPSGPATLRYARFDEPHEDYHVHHEGSAVLITAVPDADPAAPWRLASEKLAQPTRFRITTAAFDGVHDVHRDAGALTMNNVLIVQQPQ